MKNVRPSIDANNELDYGNIDYLEETSNGFLVEGNFGKVKIIGGEMIFEIKT